MADPQVVIVTGMSGAGRSTAADVLEDNGFFVIDNLPQAFIAQVADHARLFEGGRERLAVVVDSRGAVTLAGLTNETDRLRNMGIRTTFLFLDASDEVLMWRFEETRRAHPVRDGGLADKIATERSSLEDIRGAADLIIDSSDLNIHQLRDRIEGAFGAVGSKSMQVDVVSFGFKRGLPRVVDVLYDVRFLPNPHWVPDLRRLTGLDESVREYLLAQDDTRAFVALATEMLDFLVPRYVKEGKAYLTVGIGCTGGRHRSVVIAEALADHLGDTDVAVAVRHRDLQEMV